MCKLQQTLSVSDQNDGKKLEYNLHISILNLIKIRYKFHIIYIMMIYILFKNNCFHTLFHIHLYFLNKQMKNFRPEEFLLYFQHCIFVEYLLA